jgi:hypothetical protein
MAETDPRKLAELNALGLPRSEHGIGSTMRPDMNVEPEKQQNLEKERRDIERDVYERRTLTDRAAEAHWNEKRRAPGASDPAAGEQAPEDVAGENEQQGARLAHSKSQGGEPTAPDHATAQERRGDLDDTDGR